MISSALLSAATARASAQTLTEEFPQLFAKPIRGEAFSRREEQLHDCLCGDLPQPFPFLVDLGSWERRRSY